MTQTQISSNSPNTKKGENVGEERKASFCFRIIDREGKNIDLKENEYTIGREPTKNKIVIDEFYNMVSRQHAVIDLHGNKCTFTDLPTSSNGSYYQHPDGEKVDPTGKRWRRLINNAPYQIEKNTIIRLGGPYSKPESSEWICEIEIVKADYSERGVTRKPESDRNKSV